VEQQVQLDFPRGLNWSSRIFSELEPVQKDIPRTGTSPVHRNKKDREFPVPSRDVTTKLSLGGNNDVITELFPPRGSLVSDIPAGDGKLVNLYLRCRISSELDLVRKDILRLQLFLSLNTLYTNCNRKFIIIFSSFCV
jgi:hypothetical protein